MGGKTPQPRGFQRKMQRIQEFLLLGVAGLGFRPYKGAMDMTNKADRGSLNEKEIRVLEHLRRQSWVRSTTDIADSTGMECEEALRVLLHLCASGLVCKPQLVRDRNVPNLFWGVR